jgi:hypothetical protein
MYYDILCKIADDFQNNYLTVPGFADKNGLGDDDAAALIRLAQRVRAGA